MEQIIQNISAKLDEKTRHNIRNIVTDMNFSLVIALILICIVMSGLSPYFFTLKNFMNIGTYAAIIGIMAAGLTVSMLMGALDLSQYAIATFSGVVITILTMGEKISNPLVLVMIALIIGALFGFFNGVIVSIFKINPIIATMGTMYIFRSFCFIITSGKVLNFQDSFFNNLGRGYALGIPISIWIMAIVYIVIAYVLKYTAFGRKVYAVGANPVASRLSGINIKKTRIYGYVFSGITAAIAGVLMTSQVGAAIPATGVGSEMEIVAAVILGGLSLNGGKGKLSGTLLGLCILLVINNGLTLLSVQSYYQMLVRGLVLILAVFIDSIRGGGYE